MNEKLLLVRFFWDAGRSGAVESVFVTTEEELKKCYGKEVYFGEILGKHSEVYGVFEVNDITVISEDQDFIKKLVEVFSSWVISGHYPIDHIPESAWGEEEESADD